MSVDEKMKPFHVSTMSHKESDYLLRGIPKTLINFIYY